MPTITHVVVFGDSLSDIGIKWRSITGLLASGTGAMTTSASGRFSDSRNWADFMYEAASGGSLVSGSPSETIEASRLHQSLTTRSLVSSGLNNSPFYYANYAEGGACGGIPSSLKVKIALGTMKDQVNAFRRDYAMLPPLRQGVQRKWLFLVWFGANDLFTAKAHRTAMAGVAEKIADKRRTEVINALNGEESHFIYMNMGRPEAAVRYQDWKDKFESRQDNLLNGWHYKNKLEDIQKLGQGVDIFNKRLWQVTSGHGDGYVDIASTIAPATITPMLNQLNLMAGSQQLQDRGTLKNKVLSKLPVVDLRSKQNMDPSQYISGTAPMTNITTSDKVHPTDQVYKLIWDKIRDKIREKDLHFGSI